jgi:hypothetical protein
VSCAYDGTKVCITSRAALSLLTLTNVITPFCYQDERNRKRVSKYYQRGFASYLVDPNCLYCIQSMDIDGLIKDNTFAEFRLDHSTWAHWRNDQRSTPSFALLSAGWKYDEVGPYTSEDILDREEEEEYSDRVLCCQGRGQSEWSSHGGNEYTIEIFEKSPGDAIDYFAKSMDWSQQERDEVEAIPSHLRFACKHCRNAYALNLVLQQAPIELTTVDDSLRGDLTFMYSKGNCGDFNPSWYCGGAFSSLLVRKNARNIEEAYMMLRGQSIAELGRYILKHGSPVGYVKRFTYGKSVNEAFGEASKLIFPDMARPPIGLNPERFIGKCDNCGQWLHGCEFGVKMCESCENAKPRAV